jgi:hypothetical protein
MLMRMLRRSGLQRCGLAGLAAAALALPGCGDDGNGGTPDAGPDAYAGDGVAPTVKVSFPPPSSLTDTPSITLRGTAADVDDIGAIRVNGAAAQSTDGFATWTATVTLTHGANTITIESEDEYGAKDTSAAEVTVTLSANLMDSPAAVAADPANGRALVLDTQLDALVAVSYATGERTILSDDTRGTGERLQDPVAIELDAANGRALVLDGATVVAIELATGNRTPISGEASTGDPFVNATHLALDAAEKNRVLVLDAGRIGTDPVDPALFSVDLTTGERTVLLRGSSGSGPGLVSTTSMALDIANNRVLVAGTDTTSDPQAVAILAVSLETFDRTVVSTNANADQGPSIGDAVAMVLDTSATPARLIALDAGDDQILAVDLATGNRTVIAKDRETPGQDFSVPRSLALDAPADGTARIIVTDSGLDMVLGVAFADGARSVISGFNIGQGPVLIDPVSLVLDAQSGTDGRALVSDSQEEAVVSIDLATSTRTLLSGEGAGAGDAFQSPAGLTLDVETGLYGQVDAAGQVVVADPDAAALVSVDLGTGARTVLSGGPAGTGPAFAAPKGVAFDPGDGTATVPARYLVVDEDANALFAVDPANGARTIVSDADTGTGPELGAPQGVTIELDASGRTGRALVVTANPAALISVDLTTGERKEISGPNEGDGSLLSAPLSVLMELRKAPPAPPVDPSVDATPTAQPLFEPTGSALVVHNGDGNGALIAIDLTTGRRTELFQAGLGKGPLLDSPRAIWLDAENDRLVIADRNLQAVIVADRESLDRVVVSR